MIKNIVEDVVAREYDRLKETVEDFVDGEAVRDDVLAYALNRLPPKYVARRTGQVVSSLAMGSDQEMARVSVVLLEAFRVVQQAPEGSDAGSTPTP